MDVAEQQCCLRESLQRRGIDDPAVLDVIERVRRDLFVPQESCEHAWDDAALALEYGQTISQPYIVALMTESLRLTGEERVLEIGTGSGYQTAILAELCRSVVTVERISQLAEPARRRLALLDYDNIEYRTGDGTLGCDELAPFDCVLVAAAAPSIPAPLYEQLKPGGRMVIPVGDDSSQELQLIERAERGPRMKSLCGCRFVRLIGEAGW